MMKIRNKKRILFPLLVLACIFFAFSPVIGQSEVQQPGPGLTGYVKDHQDQPVQGAVVSLANPSDSNQTGAKVQDGATISTETQADGRFLLNIPKPVSGGQILNVSRAHFKSMEITLQPNQVDLLNSGETIHLKDIVLDSPDQPGVLDCHHCICTGAGIDRSGLAA